MSTTHLRTTFPNSSLLVNATDAVTSSTAGGKERELLGLHPANCKSDYPFVPQLDFKFHQGINCKTASVYGLPKLS